MISPIAIVSLLAMMGIWGVCVVQAFQSGLKLEGARLIQTILPLGVAILLIQLIHLLGLYLTGGILASMMLMLSFGILYQIVVQVFPVPYPASKLALPNKVAGVCLAQARAFIWIGFLLLSIDLLTNQQGLAPLLDRILDIFRAMVFFRL